MRIRTAARRSNVPMLAPLIFPPLIFPYPCLPLHPSLYVSLSLSELQLPTLNPSSLSLSLSPSLPVTLPLPLSLPLSLSLPPSLTHCLSFCFALDLSLSRTAPPPLSSSGSLSSLSVGLSLLRSSTRSTTVDIEYASGVKFNHIGGSTFSGWLTFTDLVSFSNPQTEILDVTTAGASLDHA